MELSSEDVERLMAVGYSTKEFVIVRGGVPRLRNVDGWCYFYSRADKKCRVYEKRPLGCRVYPVVYVEGEGFAIDELCPMGYTVSEKELKRKMQTLKKLLEKIDKEREMRLSEKQE